MAFRGNPEHLLKLKEGVKAWNEWRKSNPEIDPMLSGADLLGANLRGANLRRAYLDGAQLAQANLIFSKLQEAILCRAELSAARLGLANLRGANLMKASLEAANLSGADLSLTNMGWTKLVETNLSRANLNGARLNGANLSYANLFQTDLIEADLSEANLSQALLRDADLSGANLSGADLGGSHLNRADLSGANLSGAGLGGAYLIKTYLANADMNRAKLSSSFLVNLDLSKTLNLEKCEFGSSSIVDHLTLEKSVNLSRLFLQGIGLSEERIRSYLYGTTITVEFTEEGWGDLTPIEYALKEMLTEGYVVEKSPDRIVLKLETADLLLPALDTVGAVFAGLEAVSGGESISIKVRPKGQEEKGLEQDQVSKMLKYLTERYEEDNPRRSGSQKVVIKIFEGVEWVGPILGYAVEKGIDSLHDAQYWEKLRLIYTGFRRAFEGLIGVKHLKSKTHKELPSVQKKIEKRSD